MHQRFKMMTAFLILFLGVFLLTSQGQEARAAEASEEESKWEKPRCFEVAKKVEAAAEKAEKAAKEARKAAEELRQKGTLEAAKKAAAAAKKAQNAAKKARKVAQLAMAAGCFEVAKKAEIAAKNAESAAKEVRSIIAEVSEMKRWPKEVMESVFPIALDPQTTEQQVYQEEGREEEVSPSQ